MFNFPAMFDGAVKLFHSPNIGELMGEEKPFDLQESIAAVGITPDDLARLAPEEAIGLLQEYGIDPSDLGGGPILEQIQAVIRR